MSTLTSLFISGAATSAPAVLTFKAACQLRGKIVPLCGVKLYHSC